MKRERNSVTNITQKRYFVDRVGAGERRAGDAFGRIDAASIARARDRWHDADVERATERKRVARRA